MLKSNKKKLPWKNIASLIKYCNELTEFRFNMNNNIILRDNNR